jgi:hypothetical protein
MCRSIAAFFGSCGVYICCWLPTAVYMEPAALLACMRMHVLLGQHASNYNYRCVCNKFGAVLCMHVLYIKEEVREDL